MEGSLPKTHFWVSLPSNRSFVPLLPRQLIFSANVFDIRRLRIRRPFSLDVVPPRPRMKFF